MKRRSTWTGIQYMLCALLSMTVIGFAADADWEQKADMPTKRAAFATGVINGKIYVVGGWKVWADAGSALATLEIYDPERDTWKKGPDMRTPRGGLVAAVVDGKLYAISGGQVRQGLPAVEVYDPAADTWTRKADAPITMRGVATAVINRKIYIIGGTTAPGGIGLSTFHVYDPLTDTWEEKPDMPTARSFLSASVVNGKIYAIGGSAKSVAPIVPLDTVEVYTPDGADAPFAVSPHDKLATTWGAVRRRP